MTRPADISAVAELLAVLVLGFLLWVALCAF